ncbi:hypothetical protein DIPPA_34527 [Diplonema papillatum]|nr:hypothetical protein DIPPA_34511 [Diplonema papillatum]KAJ9468048.1 hypothetical protein DIPPA_34534 [Diplonema papillatum]KAJ9468049.1 hypothetical protein DIPPA_34527 [Diplonema papillatum]|eukprot:gene521-787_t
MSGIVLSVVAAALAAEWTDLFKPPFSGAPAELMFGISCAAPMTCYIAGGDSNTGFGVYKTTDAKLTQVSRVPITAREPPLLLMSVGTRDEKHAVTAGLEIGVGGTYYTKNGAYFNSSIEVGAVVTQAVYSTSFGYAFVGSVVGSHGVSVSRDDGLTFSGKWLPRDFAPEAPPRYGAFPSEKVWYVTGGMWPNTTQASQAGGKVVALNSRLSFDGRSGAVTRRWASAANNQAAAAPNSTQYAGMIAKTTDGGETWTKVFSTAGKFYFNGISCATESLCIAVGEGFADDGSTAPGAHVMRTEDGGSTWSEVYVYGASTHGSATAVTMLSETEVWVGTTFAQSTLKAGAQFIHSTDGGKTWTESPVLSGVADVLSMSFINSTVAFAVGITVDEDSTALAYA